MEWYKEGYYVDDFEKGMEEHYRLKHYKTNKTMKGKILEIDYSNSWTGKHGEMHTYLVRIQANDEIFFGEANAKSETAEGLPYKIGDEVEFEHESASNPDYNDKLKIKREELEGYLRDVNRAGNYSKTKGNNRSFAASYAKDLVVAGKIELKQMFEMADKIDEWMNK